MPLNVFLSSRMNELRDAREILSDALQRRAIQVFVYEQSAGARPETAVATSLDEVEKADVYVGLFWETYGYVTIQEFRHARKHGKPCLIYVRDKDLARSAELEAFLKTEVYDPTKGVTYAYFTDLKELGRLVSRDVMEWLVRRFRELSAQAKSTEVSRADLDQLRAEVTRLQTIANEQLPVGDAVDNLARELREWFQSIGYGIERDVNRIDDYGQLIINVPNRGHRYDRILVRAQSGEIKVTDILLLNQEVSAQKLDAGWAVCERRISPAARQEADSSKNLAVYTFDDLIDETVNWDNYFSWLENEVRAKSIDKYYVAIGCSIDDVGLDGQKIGISYYESLDNYIDKWLDDPAKEHISILGEFGTGKTWFALHYAHRLMETYRDAKERGVKRPRVPLIIQLRDYSKGFKDVGALVAEFVFREHEIGMPRFSTFETLNRLGRLLLIFDGFDEMATRVNRQKIVDNFWALAEVVGSGSKAILTCRSEYFQYAQEESAVLHGELRASTSSIIVQAPRFEVVEVSMFKAQQIRDALLNRTDPDNVALIMANVDLVELARRPVLIELILEALPEVELGRPIDMAHIYFYAIQRKMERDISQERTFTSLADKLYFLCEISWEMFTSDQLSFSYKSIPDRIRQYFGPKVSQSEEDHWRYDLLGQTMLVRNEEDSYTPAHRSLLEFFVAYKLSGELGALQDDFIEPARRQVDLIDGAGSRDYSWSEYFHRQRDDDGNILEIAQLNKFVAEPIQDLQKGFGSRLLTNAVVGLMRDMTEATPLWDIIKLTRNKGESEIGYIGGNLAGLLRQKGESFRGADLSGIVLSGAQLRNTDLSHANLKGTKLRGADFSASTLEDADFSGADLRGIKLEEIGSIQSLAWSPDGDLLASAGDDNDIIVWDIHKREQALTLRGHTAGSVTVCWTQDSRVLVSGSSDAQILVWDLLNPQTAMKSWKTSSPITAIAYLQKGSPEGLVFIGNLDGATASYSMSSEKPSYVESSKSRPISVLAFSPDEEFIAEGTATGTVTVRAISDGRLVSRFEGIKASVTQIGWMRQNRFLLVYKGNFTVEVSTYRDSAPDLSDDQDHRDVYEEQFEVLYNHELGRAAEEHYQENQNEFYDIFQYELSRNLGENELLELKKEFLLEKEPDFEEQLSDYVIAEINDGPEFDEEIFLEHRTRYAGFIEIWDLTKNTLALRRWGVDLNGQCFLNLSPDVCLLGGKSGRIEIWDETFSHFQGMLWRHTDVVNVLALHPNKKWIASGSRDKTIRIWNIDPSSQSFKECIATLQMGLNCRGMKVMGALGLDAHGFGRRGSQSLSEFLRERGAVR